MIDRELLEMAAKAAGIKVKGIYEDEDTLQIKPGPGMPPARWNPLADDGDALRLAVKLGMLVHINPYIPEEKAWGHVSCAWHGHRLRFEPERFTDDPYAATRLAIVRAAAEIGKAMP